MKYPVRTPVPRILIPKRGFSEERDETGFKIHTKYIPKALSLNMPNIRNLDDYYEQKLLL